MENYKAGLYPNPQDTSMKTSSAEQVGKNESTCFKTLKKWKKKNLIYLQVLKCAFDQKHVKVANNVSQDDKPPF